MQSIVTPSIAMNSQGNAFVAFGVIRTTEQQPNPTGERIWVSMVGGSGSTKISNSSSIGLTFTQYQPRIAIDNADTMYVCWLDDRNDLVYHAKDVYYDRSTTIGAIAWQEQNNSNYGNRIVNRGDPQNPPPYSAIQPDLATSPNGKQHFVWEGPWQGAWCALYRPRALDVTPPAPPANLIGMVIGCPWGMWAYVYLVWNKNTEPDVALYRVDRRNPYNEDTTFVGFTTGPADTEFYDFSIFCTTGIREYLVRAIDYADNPSAPSSAWVCPNCPDDGFSLALDLGQQQVSPYTEHRAGYRTWGGTPDKTSDVDPDRLVYRVRGLSPDSSYLLALIEYEEPSTSGRAQSVWAGDLRLREGKALPRKPKLSGFKVPKAAYRDGYLVLTIKREDGPEAALAALVLKDITHPRRGGPQSAGKVKFTSQNTYLLPPRPNPTSGRVVVEYHLPGPSQVSLAVFNVLGQSVRTLVSGKLFGGSYTEVWDGRDERGLPAKSGVYFVRLQAGGVSSTQRVVLTR